MDSAADFEDEMLALNPEYDLIFSKYNEACSRESPSFRETRKRYSPNKMKIITKMNEIIGQKPIGELPTHSDWDEQDSVEKETIALMRKFGLQQSIDRPPDEKRTISTIPTTDDVIIMRNGHKKMSIFMSDSFFELKPRSEPTFDTDDEPVSHEQSTRSEITEDTSLSSQMSSTSSDESSRIQPKSNIEYNYVSSVNSTDSSKVQSDLSWRRRSPTSAESSTSSSTSSSKDSKSRLSYSSKVWCNKTRRLKNDDNTNWRLGPSKRAEAVKPKETETQVTAVNTVEKVEPKIVQQQVKDAEKVGNDAKVEQTSVPKIVPKAISNCGSLLYKPKDLFLKKKAMLIQQVLSANQS